MKKLFSLLTLLLLLCSSAWAATTKEVYFVSAGDNGGTQSTAFTSAPTGSSGYACAFTVDGTNYTASTRTGNKSHNISFTLASSKTARLWAIHNQSDRHFTLKISNNEVTRVTTNLGFESTGSNSVYADVFDISDAGSYSLTNSQNIGLVCLILKIEDAVSCAANPSAPDGFSAGSITADGVTFTITDDETPTSYDIYYSTSSTAPESTTTATITTTSKTKAVTGLTSGTTYYAWVRAVCDASHKSDWVAALSFTTLTAPTATFDNGAYVIGGSALDLTTLWNSNSEGAVTYSVDNDAAKTGAAISTASFTATAAGMVKVKAVQAANGDYTGVTKYAYITVGSDAMGTHSITWNLNVNKAESSIGTASKVPTSIYTPATDLENNGLTITANAKSSLTSKIEVPSSYSENKYMYVTFSVADGYIFTPTSISVKVQPVKSSSTADVKLVLSDGTNTLEKSQTGLSAGSTTTVTESNSSGKSFAGDVTLKIYCYGASETYRLGTPITISGTLEEVVPMPISAVKWATFSNTNEVAIPSGVTAYRASASDGSSYVTLTEIENYIPANTGVVVYADIAAAKTFYAVKSSEGASLGGTNLLNAWTEAGEPSEDTYYTLAVNEGNPIFKLSSGGTLAAGKAYLVLPGETPAPSIHLVIEGENNATDIKSVEETDAAVKFMENGKLLIIREGVTYDALGRVIR